jgi:4a-hydroxytetrahydrobiopterin dehydratase
VTELPLTRQQIADALGDGDWRYILGVLRTSVPADSLAHASTVATRAVGVAGTDADSHLAIDVRPDRVVLTLQTAATASVTPRDIELAAEISSALDELGLGTDPPVSGRRGRSMQVIEVAIDAMDIPSIRPFWRAVLGYVDELGRSGPDDPLVDALGQGPAVWFQQMDRPRPQRNRIHLDVSVPHDEAPDRLRSALAAGGTLVSDARAPAFWVLADPEGNEACITTWQGRDG